MKFPTGGKAREPRGMIRCNSEARRIVWMKEMQKLRQAYTCVHSKALK